MSYNCDNHPENAGALLLTNLANGDVTSLCGECILPWAIGIARATAGDGNTVEIMTEVQAAALAQLNLDDAVDYAPTEQDDQQSLSETLQQEVDALDGTGRYVGTGSFLVGGEAADPDAAQQSAPAEL